MAATGATPTISSSTPGSGSDTQNTAATRHFTAEGVAGPRPAAAHVALNVSAIQVSIEWYRILFDRAPARSSSDYACFELDEPALVVSLFLAPGGAPAPLNHVGLRLPELSLLDALETRLRAAGLAI